MDDLTRLALDAADGDRLALTSFVRRTQPEVWRLCAYLVDRQHADDLTQDTYLRAIKALPSFRAESSARTWLLSVARHTCMDALRATHRRRHLRSRLAAEPVEHVADATPASDLHDLIAGLDADRRTAFVLTQVLGLGYAEAAEVVGCPIGTIRSRVARARADLLASSSDEGRDEADGTAAR
ncbi:MAG: sigma-70 family RNA polymerase sigma factor [Acidimicrobiales bacterium]